MKKTISGGARQAKRSLDSGAVSSLLALISRECNALHLYTSHCYTNLPTHHLHIYVYSWKNMCIAIARARACMPSVSQLTISVTVEAFWVDDVFNTEELYSCYLIPN